MKYPRPRHCSTWRHWQLLSVAVLLGFVGGCGSGAAKLGLQGTVTYRDGPIEKGRIDFIPIDGTTGPSVGAPISQGRYVVAADQGVVAAGTYQVRITAYRKTGRKEPNRVDRGGPPIDVEENIIPSNYNTQSTLKVHVAETPDKNKLDFHLDKSPTAA
jgi:hypothetical protein